MEKKATLLIKHIHTIYTMQEEGERNIQFQHGFIAIHHDEIIDLGTHDFTHLVDKDTRILDGTNHIAVPAFIEVDGTMSKNEKKGLLEQNEYFMRYMKNGTLCIHMKPSIRNDLLHNYHYEVLNDVDVNPSYPVVHALAHMNTTSHLQLCNFCISSSHEQVSLQSQMMAAQLLAMKDHIDAYELLKAITINPARFLKREDLGVLDIGKCANIVLLSVKDIHSFFYSLDQNCISQIIHKGVRIYPNLLI